jgi:hypothetical protein
MHITGKAKALATELVQEVAAGEAVFGGEYDVIGNSCPRLFISI